MHMLHVDVMCVLVIAARDQWVSATLHSLESVVRDFPQLFYKVEITRTQAPHNNNILGLGSSTWTFLHTMSSYYPDNPEPPVQQSVIDLMNAMSKLYPCSFCAKHLGKELLLRPPDVSSRERLELWMCELHNEVNERTIEESEH